ncbi:MAG TPA: hypothetical protein VJ323_04495, partial [Bryobacteraceae bacterium]|nr:hypothetical protein [Bryobacteraceae bacterium]
TVGRRGFAGKGQGSLIGHNSLRGRPFAIRRARIGKAPPLRAEGPLVQFCNSGGKYRGPT